MQNIKKIILWAVMFILLLGNIYFGAEYFSQVKETNVLKEKIKVQQTNVKIINFLNLFIEKVLKAEREIPFEERLQLENSIRDIGDQELLEKWEKFTESTDEIKAQTAVKDLLDSLTNKIIVQ